MPVSRAVVSTTCVTRAVWQLLEAGLEDQEVSGHKSMQMLRRYTHLLAEGLVSRLDQLIGQ
jgi:hypothetical protein